MLVHYDEGVQGTEKLNELLFLWGGIGDMRDLKMRSGDMDMSQIHNEYRVDPEYSEFIGGLRVGVRVC
jgi:hypothetical protein